MFFKTQDTVFRAGGIHGAILTIDWRNITSIHFNHETHRVESMIRLFAGGFLRTILVPRPFEGRSVCHCDKGEKEYQECYNDSHLAGWGVEVLECCLVPPSSVPSRCGGIGKRGFDKPACRMAGRSNPYIF